MATIMKDKLSKARKSRGCKTKGRGGKGHWRPPTAEDVNEAIMLLLWRCRDAEIHKDTPSGRRGYYGLCDWIAKASNEMIHELGLWCADIQELNTGNRDS